MSFKVLMYHEIRNGIVQGLEIDVANGYQDVLPKVLYSPIDSFKKQMIYLKQKNYYFMSAQDLVDFYENGKVLPHKAILITFDDGFQSQYLNAYPILKELDIPAVMFFIGSWLFDKDKPVSASTTRTMTHSQMNEITDVFKKAHHTFDLHNRHKFLSYDFETLKSDFELNKPYLDYPEIFAYPFGLYNDEMAEKLHKLGIKYAFTSDPGVNNINTNPMYLSRYLAHYDMGLEVFVEMLESE